MCGMAPRHGPAPPFPPLSLVSLSLSNSLALSLDTEGQIGPHKQLPRPWVINKGKHLTLGS